MAKKQTNQVDQSFLFVNKFETSHTLSKSQSQEATAIQRHVQTGRKRPRKTDRLVKKERYRSLPDRSILLPQPAKSSVTSDWKFINSKSALPVRDSGKELQNSKQHQKYFINGDCHDELLTVDQMIAHKLDPFDVTCIPIDSTMASLFNYYIRFYHPSQWPHEMALRQHGIIIYENVLTNVMKTAMMDKLSMYCLLSASSCRLQFVDRFSSTLISGTENVYLSRALPLLASFIKTVDLKERDQFGLLLRCIMFLSAADCWRQEIPAARAHFSAAAKLLDSGRHLMDLENDNVHLNLAMGDLFLACVDFTPCLLDFSYDPGPASSLNLSSVETSRRCTMGTASCVLENSGTFVGIKLRQIFHELIELHTVKCRMVIGLMTPDRARQVTHWVTLRNMAIRNRLLSLKTTDLRVHCLRAATVMWTLLSMNITGRAKTVKIMAPKLKDILSETKLLEWNGHEDVRIWVILIGFTCAIPESEAYFWFWKELCQSKTIELLSKLGDIESCSLQNKLETFQHKFLYDVQAQREDTRIVSDKLQRHIETIEF